MRCQSCGEAAADPGEACPECGSTVEQPAGEGPETSLGFDRNVGAALAYSLTFASGLLFYVLEDDGFVRFHAAQSVVVFGTVFGLALVVETVGGVLAVAGGAGAAVALSGPVTSALGLLGAVAWLGLMYKAARGERVRVPVAGSVAERYV